MPPTATRLDGQRRGCSTWGLLALALLPIASQDQFTGLFSPKRYNNRYEEKFEQNFCLLPAPATTREAVVAPRMWRCGARCILTNQPGDVSLR